MQGDDLPEIVGWFDLDGVVDAIARAEAKAARAEIAKALYIEGNEDVRV